MELTNIKTIDRAVDIVHPSTGEEIGLRITVMSVNDDRMKKISRRLTDKALTLRQRGKTFSAEEIETNKNLLILEASLGWEWTKPEATFEGGQPDFSRKAMADLMRAAPWIVEQLDAEIGDSKSFFST